MKKINCPTLIIAGGLDRRTTQDMQKELKETIQHAVLKIIRGSEHFTPLQSPVEFNAALLGWMIKDAY